MSSLPSATQSSRRCTACGSEIKESTYQMRAADEAHTSVWSCGMCPLDPSRISFSDTKRNSFESYPLLSRLRALSDRRCASRRPIGSYTHLETFLTEPPAMLPGSKEVLNIRRPCSVPGEGYNSLSRAHFSQEGVYAGSVVRLTSTEEISSKCYLASYTLYKVEDESALGSAEADGTVFLLLPGYGRAAYVHKRQVGDRSTYVAVVPMRCSSPQQTKEAVMTLCLLGVKWPGITGFVTRDRLASINNLSPRAWDSRRIQRRGAKYTPKVDGERAYVLVFKGIMHVFSRSKGYPHIGLRVLKRRLECESPVVVDVENTVSHGMFLIDMLTWSDGRASPRERDCAWFLKEFSKLQELTGDGLVREKGYYDSLQEAEKESRDSRYPTDGVIALWPGTTTSRKMKAEKSVELSVEEGGCLSTSDGDNVLKEMDVPQGVSSGDIVEVRFKLCEDGKSVRARPMFKRADKACANGSSAVASVLSSFSSVVRDNETRRREVLMWCDSLKQHLIRVALSKKGSRRIVIDVGTGTGQSLDVLTSDKGVSYLLVEPSEERCEMLRRRTGVRKIMKDPREIMSVARSLKLGSQTYAIANMELSQIMSEEDLMKLIGNDVAFVSATFSAHFVVAELYELCTHWSIPMVGCMYPYDGVDVGDSLVKALGVTMTRSTSARCTVKWGGDVKYEEPYTAIQEYQPFSTVTRAIDLVPPPNIGSDRDAWNICSKVYMIENLQGL